MEVILNALALEFVFKIDEEYAVADWWDPCKSLPKEVDDQSCCLNVVFNTQRDGGIKHQRWKLSFKVNSSRVY